MPYLAEIWSDVRPRPNDRWGHSHPLMARGPLPVCAGERTFPAPVGTSVSCHEENSCTRSKQKPYSITSSSTPSDDTGALIAKRLGGLEVDVSSNLVTRMGASFWLCSVIIERWETVRNPIGSSCNKRSASETQGGYQPIDEAARGDGLAVYDCCQFWAPPG